MKRIRSTWVVASLVTAVLTFFGSISFAQMSDENEIRDFLKVTGFDVSITSMQQSAMAGPALTGQDPDTFGRQWIALAQEVFNPDEMIADAVKMMSAVMPQDLLDHGVEFYESPLGQKLVAMENESHMADDEVLYGEGENIVTELAKERSILLQLYKEMNQAIGSTDTTIKSIVEIQVRYLMAAVANGASDFDIGEDDLRLMLMEQADQMRASIESNSLIANAYTYQGLTQGEVIDYLSALQEPNMGQIYEILNAIQYEIMAERYELLASRLAELEPEHAL